MVRLIALFAKYPRQIVNNKFKWRDVKDVRMKQSKKDVRMKQSKKDVRMKQSKVREIEERLIKKNSI